jgi:SsrA-binding protein
MDNLVKNKKASYEYHILEKFVCGMVLQGSEVKSIRLGKASISEAYCYVKNGEVFVKNMHISEYKQSNKYDSHDPVRERKLLLKKKEIIKLSEKVSQKGLTIIPLAILLTDTGYMKLEIALAKGKHLYDKRETIKSRDLDLEIKRNKI